MFGLQFHWYGFLIGLALVVGVSLTEELAKRRQVPTQLFWQVVSVVITAGLIGSRVWHVATDYQAYVGHWLNVFAIWNGGLSIIGTVVGAVVAFFLFFQLHPTWRKYQFLLLDLSVFGLAIGQAIGRLGNYVNQELYGLPTNLFIGIKIDQAHRLPGFEQFSTYQPLFAYEIVFLLIFVIMAWQLQKKVLKIGTGVLFLFYVVYYSWIRFGLDFLRIDKALSPILGLGINQLFLLVTGVLSTAYLVYNLKKDKNRHARST